MCGLHVSFKLDALFTSTGTVKECIGMYVNVCECIGMYVNVCECIGMYVNV